jgi:predicted DNA-binding transcriptional regulator YafY
MNRTANTIALLVILQANPGAYLKKKDLAARLQVNERNIREYLQELRLAGYEVEDRHGRGGGIRLKPGQLFAAAGLTEKEADCLCQAAASLRKQGGVSDINELESAIGKVLSNSGLNRQSIRYLGPDAQVNAEESRLEALFRHAASQSMQVLVQYRGRKDAQSSTYLFDPYEVFVLHNVSYVAGWSHKANDWRTLRISSQRILSADLNGTVFSRDSLFNLTDLLHGDRFLSARIFVYTVKVRASRNHLFVEAFRKNQWGWDLKEGNKEGEWMEYTFQHHCPEEGLDLELFQGLYALQGDAVLVKPEAQAIAFETSLENLSRICKEESHAAHE